MGKSPGKWIKSFLRGKKSSKSNLSREKDILKSANEKAVSVSPKAPVLDVSVDTPSIVQPVSGFDPRNEAVYEHVVSANLPDEGVSVPLSKECEKEKENANLGSQEDPERIMHEKAATKAQAAVRGHLARREFQKLKRIIWLQAFIRGHLVRRQAVSTLRCVQAIIKFQALIRGQKVRSSSFGIEVQKKCNLGKIMGDKCSESNGVYASAMAEPILENSFAQKLVASSSTTLPLCHQYGPGEPNSAWEWLERWTRSLLKKNMDSKSHTKSDSFKRKGEIEQGRPKRSVRKPSGANVGNVSIASSGSEKPKRNQRKFSSHPVHSDQEHPKNELEKGKSNRRTFESKKQAGERVEVDNAEPKHSVIKGSGNAASEVSEQGTNGSVDKKVNTTVRVSKQPDVTGLKVPSAYDHTHTQEHPDLNLQPVENNGKSDDIEETDKQLNAIEHHTSNENENTNQRRASFPLNVETQENGVYSTRKVPSYMAPTESARAKLRALGSPKYSQEEFEKNGATRRHSLPSSNNMTLTSMSPRAQGLNKGMIRSDRSLTSSRDGSVSEKVIKAEWRR